MKMTVILVEDEETTMAAPAPMPSTKCCEYTLDGSVDIKGHPAVKGKSGGWLAGGLILGMYNNSAAQPFLPFLLSY
jgi:solute carrier family 15 (peptide/histidine transporter), member 3/4